MLIKSFFNDRLTQAFHDKNLKLCMLSSEYVVSVLCDFVKSDMLTNLTEDETPFPLMVSLYQKSIASAPLNKFNDFRNIGDVALFISGIFPDFIQRKKSLVGKDYYINMGKTGYSCASKLIKVKEFSMVFNELSNNFPKIVDALNLIDFSRKKEL